METSNWWLGHQVLIAPQWIDDVNWFDCKVSVDLTRQAVKVAPPYEGRGRWTVCRKWASTNTMGAPAIGPSKVRAELQDHVAESAAGLCSRFERAL